MSNVPLPETSRQFRALTDAIGAAGAAWIEQGRLVLDAFCSALRSGPSPDPGDEQSIEQQGEQPQHDKDPSSRGDAASAAGEV